MFNTTRLLRGYSVRPLPTNLTPTERFIRGSMRLWSRQVGDRRLKGTVPLAGFLEFIARRSLERRTRLVDLSASADGEELPEMLNAWRMLTKARTVDVNDVTETVHVRSYFDYTEDGFYSTVMRSAASWRPNEKVPLQRLIDDHFPNMTIDDFVVAQTLIDEFVGMKDNCVFVVNRYGEDDYTFLLRRALWSAGEDGIAIDELEDKMRELWMADSKKANNDGSNNNKSSNQEDDDDEMDGEGIRKHNTKNDDGYLPTSGFRRFDSTAGGGVAVLPSLPFRCKSALDVLNENLPDWFFAVQDRTNYTSTSTATAPLRIFYFGWDAVLKDVIRTMPVTGNPSYFFRRAVLAHHPCLAHSKLHGSWKSMMERLLLRYDEWVTISVARSDNNTHIIRRLLPMQTHAKVGSVTSETIKILSLMENMNENGAKSSNNKWVSFDDVARCMSTDVKAQVEGAASVFQLLKLSHFLEPDVRLFVRETATRASSDTIVLVDLSAVLSSTTNSNNTIDSLLPKLLLQANPSDAPHGRLICARKKNEVAFSSSSNKSDKKNSTNNNNDDVVAPAWMPNSVILVAQLAKYLATNANSTSINNIDNNSSENGEMSGSGSRKLKNVIVIVGEREDKVALQQEISQLVGEGVGIEFASAKLN